MDNRIIGTPDFRQRMCSVQLRRMRARTRVACDARRTAEGCLKICAALCDPYPGGGFVEIYVILLRFGATLRFGQYTEPRCPG